MTEKDFSTKASSLGYVKESGYDDQYVADIPEISAKGMATGMLVMEENNPNKRSLSAIYYNYKGEAIQTRMVDQDDYATVVNNLYTFTGALLKSKSERKSLTAAQEGNLTEEYVYELDHAERVKKITRNGIDLAVNNYDELGRVESQFLHGRDTVSYQYNIRDWVTNIDSKDFHQQLYYEKRPNGREGLYNGNISYMKNQSPALAVDYHLEYDGLNRNTFCCGNDLKNDRNDCLSEYITYDSNTNPLQILRTSSEGSWWNDLLTLSYNGNQLNSVSDEYGGQNNPDMMEFTDYWFGEKDMYAYDANGNMVKDKHRKISKISYNSLNLPDTIQFSNGNQIINRYLADGTKLSAKYLTYPINIVLPDDTIVKVEEDPRTTIIDHYCGNYHYTTQNGIKQLTRILTPYGYIKYAANKVAVNLELLLSNNNIQLNIPLDSVVVDPDEKGKIIDYSQTNNMLYCYNIKDYQGNIRQVVQFDENGNRQVIQSTDYYPSGTVVQTSTGQWEQPYKYNGK